MDAARESLLLQYTERRKLRLGDVTGVAGRNEKITRRGLRTVEETALPDDAAGLGHVVEDEEAPPPPSSVTRRHSNGETDAEQDARVAREKAQYKALDADRKAGQALLESRLQATGKMAAQFGLPGLDQWKKQQQAERLAADKDAEKSDYETRINASTAALNRYLAEARNSSNSWQYRQQLLERAKDTVATHLTDLGDLHDKFYDKFNDFAGNSQLQAKMEQQMSDVDKRRKFLEEYYSALEHLAGNDPLAGAEFRRLGAAAGGKVDPAMVRNSSKMRLLARRRRQSWSEVA